MFRTKKNMTINETILTKKSSIFTNTESSTDECSNHKSTINQFKHKISPNIIILNNKYLSTHMASIPSITSIPSIPSIESSDKRNFNYKKEDLIKEEINNDIFPETANRFRSLYDLDEKKSNLDLNNEVYNQNDMCTRTSSLMSKNTLKKNYYNIRENSVDNFIKNNILKKSKRKNISINKLKIIDNCIMTPKKIINMKSKNIFTIEKNLNNSDFYYSRTNTDSKKSRKDQIKYNLSLNKNNMSYISLKDYSYYNSTTRKTKEQNLPKLNEIMNYNKSPNLKINRDNRMSLLTQNINKNKRIITLQNNINFDYLVNSCNKNSKKRLKLKLFSDKKEKTDFFINSDFEDSKSNNPKNMYRINKNIFYNLNLSNNKMYNKKIPKIKTISENKKNHIYLDSSPMAENYNHYQSRNHSNNIFSYQYKEKINKNNYKILLNDIKNRMSFLVDNLINYIQFLKNDKNKI